MVRKQGYLERQSKQVVSGEKSLRNSSEFPRFKATGKRRKWIQNKRAKEIPNSV